MNAIKTVADSINAEYARTAAYPDELSIDAETLSALKDELQATTQYINQGYVVADGPVNWDDFRFMGVRLLPVHAVSEIAEEANEALL